MATILLIEDEEPMRTTIGKLLRFAGHTVIEARDGNEGLSRHAEGLGEFNLVICDLILPKTAGVELIRKLRERAPNVAILAISGAAHVLKRLGSDGSAAPHGKLAKPFTPAQLINAVNNLVCQHLPSSERGNDVTASN